MRQALLGEKCPCWGRAPRVGAEHKLREMATSGGRVGGRDNGTALRSDLRQEGAQDGVVELRLAVGAPELARLQGHLLVRMLRGKRRTDTSAASTEAANVSLLRRGTSALLCLMLHSQLKYGLRRRELWGAAFRHQGLSQSMLTTK